jgi:hypothetical protein
MCHFVLRCLREMEGDARRLAVRPYIYVYYVCLSRYRIATTDAIRFLLQRVM